MLRTTLRRFDSIHLIPRYSLNVIRSERFLSDSTQSKDELTLRNELGLEGFEDLDSIMNSPLLKPLHHYYPNTSVQSESDIKPFGKHNVMVIQPWINYSNFGGMTDPDLQLMECISLANTVKDWTVVDKKILFSKELNRKQILGPKAFVELKEEIMGKKNVTAVFFGVENLSAIQLGTLEKELNIPVYDRFTVVLSIFRQHARTKEAKLQLALAELPYIQSHLREIHNSCEHSSSTDALKYFVGGAQERFFHKRVQILKRRENRLRALLAEVLKDRDVNQKSRSSSDIPVVAVVGYTNSGKTSLIKYLTGDERLQPLDQLFATLDVSIHRGQLPSNKHVFYIDTVGFISRIPLLLVDAFSATLKDVKQSDLILHVADITHPDRRLQHATVIKALEKLNVAKELLSNMCTVGNKCDLFDDEAAEKTSKYDLYISATKGTNMQKLAQMLDEHLVRITKNEKLVLRVENGGPQYQWLLKNVVIQECVPDADDENYLICHVVMSPTKIGRWRKMFGQVSKFYKPA